MINGIWFRNYGPFEEAELALERLTVIVGPNASGKTIALESLYRVQKSKNILISMKRRGSQDDAVQIGFRTKTGERGSWELRSPDPLTELTVRDLDLHPQPRTILLQLRPRALRESSYLDSARPMMKEDGFGLATTLVELKVDDSEAFTSILEKTRRIVPTFEGLRFKRTQVKSSVKQPIYGHELVFDMKGAADLAPSAVSDGTLLTLGLLTLTMEYSRKPEEGREPTLFLIDELERGLHPRALSELVGQLRRLAEEADVQILATSHSPYLVDCLNPEEVRLTGLLKDGTATIGKLEDHPDFERWKEEMSPGEFWSTVGEDWVR